MCLYVCLCAFLPASNVAFFLADGEWLVGSWSPCQVGADRARDAEGQCHGVRKRTSKCQIQGADVPLDQCPRPRPTTEAACITTCPQDCVVGPWGLWGPCVSCDGSQRRTRTVVVAPTPGGSPCPALSESRPCLDCDPSGASPAPPVERKETEVRLRVGEWGPCQALTSTSYEPIDDEDEGEDDAPLESNSIAYPEEDKYTTFPEDTAQEEEAAISFLEVEDKYATFLENVEVVDKERSGEPGGGRTTARPQEPREWSRADLPHVGRQERSLTCVHVNGTRLPLR